MTFNSNQDQENNSPWNPFVPTARDIERTDELAGKNPAIAGVLSFFLLPAAMIYLNRGINNLKILGYVFVAGVMIGMVTSNRNSRDTNPAANLIGVLGNIAVIAENTRTITLARKRQSEINE
ncbi:hypothetical protein Riv7116_0041 [Rivularia sp. PCC 7116]|uniref:hypothetical protein n=1 Tax=Rivularia sp. PCC 7116 TaxID=373994 RepID=UPI00029EF825|nr:hypothetical protein [Rivularia sp. PCC 7116]AFY52656.1 hypothetical protein Riv7116_0041 [Rivularia sp. PCC 7116]